MSYVRRSARRLSITINAVCRASRPCSLNDDTQLILYSVRKYQILTNTEKWRGDEARMRRRLRRSTVRLAEQAARDTVRRSVMLVPEASRADAFETASSWRRDINTKTQAHPDKMGSSRLAPSGQHFSSLAGYCQTRVISATRCSLAQYVPCR